MRLLGREAITVTGHTRAWSAGNPVLSTIATFSIYGSVQPAPQSVIDRLPEGSRRAGKWVVYFESIPAGLSALTPNLLRFSCSRGTLIPLQEMSNVNHSSGLPHVAYVCAEEGDDE